MRAAAGPAGNHSAVATVLVDPDREFEELYRRYAAEVHRYALALSQSEVDAEDVTQQTFMNAYRAFVRGEQPRAPLHWLIAIAHNVVRERLRRSSRRPTEVALDDNVRAAAPEETPWSAEEIRKALTHLCPKQRAVMVLRELEGRPYAEIARSLGLSRSATEALAFRARRALREQLETELTCEEAQAAVPRALEGGLSAAEHGALRAHLRACDGCAGAARSRRGRLGRRLGSLAILPFPLPLKSLFGGGSASAGAASAGGGIAVKAAAVAAAGVVATGVGYETVRHAAVHRAGGATSAAAGDHSPSAPAEQAAATARGPAPIQNPAPVAQRPANAGAAAHAPLPANRHQLKRHAPERTRPKADPVQAQPSAAEPSEGLAASKAEARPRHAPKSHVAPKPKPAPASKHDAAPRHKPTKHEHVQKAKAQHHGRSAGSPGGAGGGLDSADANGSAAQHGNANGKGNSGKNGTDAATPTETDALSPPPDQARAAGEADG